MSAKPSAPQLRMLAKMGIAMPDGSYYIRDAEDLGNAIDAVGRGEPQSSHNAIRKFIMKRAAALKLSSKIPANWNPDGSLKQPAVAQSAEERGEALLSHFGRKGMHWGEHVFGSKSSGGGNEPSDHDKLIVKAKQHEAISAAHAAASVHARKEADEVYEKGVQSAAFKRVYGHQSVKATPLEFYAAHGQSKSYALAQTHSNLRRLSNSYARSANRHSAKALKIRSKAAGLNHSTLAELDRMGDEEVLAHFGRKGMKWGEHVYGEGEHASADAARAAKTADTIRKHGVHAVSTPDLQHLVSRQNLEQQHSKLTAGGTDAGKKAAGDLIKNVAKQQAQALATQYAQKGVEHVTKAIARELTSSKHGG